MSRLMKCNLQTAIRTALAGSSSQQPVDVAQLYPLGTRKQVQDALLELYHGRQVYCCLYQRVGAKPSSVWWLVGAVGAPHSFGSLCKPKVAVGQVV